MSKGATLAVEALDAAFGHETAHLSLDEQIDAALSAARRMNAIAATLIEERHQTRIRCTHGVWKGDRCWTCEPGTAVETKGDRNG